MPPTKVPIAKKQPRALNDGEFATLVDDAFTRAEAGYLTMDGLFNELDAIGRMPLTEGQRQLLEEILSELQELVDEAAEPPLSGQWNIGDIDLPTSYEVGRSLGLELSPRDAAGGPAFATYELVAQEIRRPLNVPMASAGR